MKFLFLKTTTICILVAFHFKTFAQTTQPKNKINVELSNLTKTNLSDEFGNYPINEKFYFLSNQKIDEVSKTNLKPDQKQILSLFNSDAKHQRIKKAESIKQLHVGPICQIPNSQQVIVTIDEMQKVDTSKRFLKMYMADIKKNGELKDLKPLNINSLSSSSGHPTVSSDGKYLIFASDRPGGFGGVDLYYAEINQGKFIGNPINLGPNINSSANEMFPFLSYDGTLFYSSNTSGGLGGLDVYATKFNHSNQLKGLLLSNPINSPFDDFAFILLKDNKSGFVSSNRISNQDDIFQFSSDQEIQLAPELIFAFKNKANNQPINNVNITLTSNNSVTNISTNEFSNAIVPYQQDLNKITSAKIGYFQHEIAFNQLDLSKNDTIVIYLDEKINKQIMGQCIDPTNNTLLYDVKVSAYDPRTNTPLKTTTDQSGRFGFLINELKAGQDLNYNIILEKEGYLTKEINIAEVVQNNTLINLDTIQLLKLSKGVDLGKLLALNPIYFDYNKWDIRPDAALELDKIVKYLNTDKTLKISLEAHTDSRGNDQFNLNLSQKRAKASANYIQSRIDDQKRVTFIGMGEKNPIVNCPNNMCSEEQHALNRRTEFILK